MCNETPQDVQDLVHVAHCAVSDAIGITPDLSQDTLPLFDTLLRNEVANTQGARRTELLVAVAAHFGEVCCRLLDGRWAFPSSDPRTWRVELRACFLYFYPLGMAAEVMLGCESPDYDGSFGTLDALHADLSTMLAGAAPMSEEAYFSLGGRIEVLQLVADWLTSNRLVEGRGVALEPFSADDYNSELEGPG